MERNLKCGKGVRSEGLHDGKVGRGGEEEGLWKGNRVNGWMKER